MESSHWIPIVHGIECCHFIDSHGWHFQYPSYLIHNTYAREAMLPLAKIKKGHHGCLFVLRRISFQYFSDKFVVDFIEFEGYRGIVGWRIAVLKSGSDER